MFCLNLLLFKQHSYQSSFLKYHKQHDGSSNPENLLNKVMMDGLVYLVLLEDLDFLLFLYGWSRLDSVQGECWMGGRSSAGLEVKLIIELMLGLGDLLGVRGRGCGVTDGDM